MQFPRMALRDPMLKETGNEAKNGDRKSLITFEVTGRIGSRLDQTAQGTLRKRK